MNNFTGSRTGAETLYEFPLRDSTRVFMRLEVLDRQLECISRHGSAELNRTTAHAVLGALDLVFREDLRAHLLQQIHRLQHNYEALRAREDIRQENLTAMLEELGQFREELGRLNANAARTLRFDPLISALRQRDSITDAAMAIDVPMYQWWLHAGADHCRRDFERWVEAFRPLMDANRKILEMLRQRGEYRYCEASQGSFAASIARDQELWMVRVGVRREIPCFPQVSGTWDSGRIHLRFLQTPAGENAGELYQTDFGFTLAVC